MKLHWPPLERTVRRRVRQAKRESPALRRECRRQRRRRIEITSTHVRLGLTLWLLGVMHVLRGDNPTENMLTVLTVWGVVAVIVRAAALHGLLHTDHVLGSFAGLPTSDALVFRWQWQRWARRAVWTWLDFVAGYVVVFGFQDLGLGGWLRLGIAASAQWLMIGVAAMALVRWRPSGRYATWSVGLLALGFLSTLLHEWTIPLLLAALERVGPALNALLPFGWVSHGLRRSLSGEGGFGGFALVLALGLGAGCVWEMRARMLRRFELAKIVGLALEPDEEGDLTLVLAQTDTAAPEPAGSGSESKGDGSPKPAPLPSEAVLRSASRTFLEADAALFSGPLERIFRRRLTPRDHVLLEAMRATPLAWTRTLRQALVLAIIGPILAWLMLRAVPQFPMPAICLLGVLGFVLVVMVLPLASGFTRCFQPMQFWGGQLVAFHAGMPMGYHEVVRLMIRAAVLRTLVGAPVIVGYGALAFQVFKLNPAAGAVVGLKTAWLVLTLVPVLAACAFSAGTNDSRRMTWRGVRFLAVAVSLGLVYVGLAATSFLAPAGPAWLFALLAWLPSLLGFWFYGRWFNRCRFDLLPAPPQN
jgi:hypothetical protein